MAVDFPQEILDAVVDEVAQLRVHSLWALLKSSPVFGSRCRMHLYREVTIRPLSSQSPFHLHSLVMQYDVGHLVDTLCVHLYDDDTRPFWKMICEIMAKMTALENLVLSEAIAYTYTHPSKMPFADLPRLSTVRSLELSLVHSLSAEDVAHVLLAYKSLSSFHVANCDMDWGEPSATPTPPPVQIALEELCVVNTQFFMPSIFLGSVAPPIISLHKLRRLVVGERFTQRTWPSYEALFKGIQGTVKEVVMYNSVHGFPRETSFFVNVPSLVIVPPFESDFDFLVNMLRVADGGDQSSSGLERLALVFDWTTYQQPIWNTLADLFATSRFQFSVCITLAWTASSKKSQRRALSDVRKVTKWFEGSERLIRVQAMELAIEEGCVHKQPMEVLYY